MREYLPKYYLNLLAEYVSSNDAQRKRDIGEIFKRHPLSFRSFSTVAIELIKLINNDPQIFAALNKDFALNAKQLRQLLVVASKIEGAAFRAILQNSGFNPKEPKEFCGENELDHDETVAVCVAAGAKIALVESWRPRSKIAYFLATLAHGTIADTVNTWIYTVYSLEFSDADKNIFARIDARKIEEIERTLNQNYDLQVIPADQLMYAARDLFNESIYDGSQPQEGHINARAEFYQREIIKARFKELVDWASNKRQLLSMDLASMIRRNTKADSMFEDLCNDVGLDPFMFNAYMQCSLHRYKRPDSSKMSLLSEANSQSLQAMLDGEADDQELSDNVEFYLASLLRIHNFHSVENYYEHRARIVETSPALIVKIDQFIKILYKANSSNPIRIEAAKTRIECIIDDLILSDTFEIEGARCLSQLIQLAEAIVANTATAEDIDALFNNPSRVNNRYSVRYFSTLRTFLSVSDLVNFLELDSASSLVQKRNDFHVNIRRILPLVPPQAVAVTSGSATITPAYTALHSKRVESGVAPEPPKEKRARPTLE